MAYSDKAVGDALSAGDNQAPASPPPRSWPSAALLQGAKSVEIVHNGLIYRLQATRLGKLILTK